MTAKEHHAKRKAAVKRRSRRPRLDLGDMMLLAGVRTANVEEKTLIGQFLPNVLMLLRTANVLHDAHKRTPEVN